MCLLGDLAKKPSQGCSQTHLLTMFGLLLYPFPDAMVAAKRRR